MADTTGQSEAIMQEARQSLQTQQQGGYHRQAGRGSIGAGSADLRRRNLLKRVKLIFISLFAILVAAGIAGIMLDGIGFVGVMATFLAIVAAITIFSQVPKVRTPRRADLTRTTDAGKLVARTELWLERQRPALPAPAVKLVDDIGVQLDALGLQLEHIDPAHPAAAETRKLVGEHLPETVDAFRRIPQNLRREQSAGSTPEDQLVESLGKISSEIDRVTRQLAAGALDDLAVRTRYLEYRYGDGPEGEKG